MQQFSISRDDRIYEAFPDLALSPSGRLVCVFTECTHHHDRSYTRLVLTTSDDQGRTWTPKQPLTAPCYQQQPEDPSWNCPRISTLADGRMAIVADHPGYGNEATYLWTSCDDGTTWQDPQLLPVMGIVPDRLVELRCGPHAGRWIVAAQTIEPRSGGEVWTERCWHSDDQGASWQGPYTIVADPTLLLCEGNILELSGGELVCFLRENSNQGFDGYKAISRDGGITWEGPCPMPIPGCHRPTAGLLRDGRVLLTYRFVPGGRFPARNFMAALTDQASCLAHTRGDAGATIYPLDFDRHAAPDLGYSGWVQLSDEEIYIANYIMNDASTAQIRGYLLQVK